MSRWNAISAGLIATALVCALALLIATAPPPSSRRGPVAGSPSALTPLGPTDAATPAETSAPAPTGKPRRSRKPKATPTKRQAAACPGALDAPELTVLTFNIHGGNGRDGYDLQRIASEIRATDADVVLLQEVHRFRRYSRFADQPADLSRLTGMDVVFGPTFSRAPEQAGRPRRESGNALLSRWPILSWENTPLVNQPGMIPRALLRATIAIGKSARTVDVYAAHLQHQGRTIRPMQARHIKDLVAQRDLPFVIGGDLNSPPQAQAMQIMGSFTQDPWPVVGPGPGFTVPAGSPRIRIDYVLHGAGWQPVSSQVLPTAASDHRPVRTTLRLVQTETC